MSLFRRKTRQGPVETDPRFPSGRWTGFWIQRLTGRGHMGLVLRFGEGIVQGEGSDLVGDFAMSGTYDLKTGKVSLLKTYHGAHSVRYEGQNEGDGLWIWGLWHIGIDRGGFHIWPEGEEDPTRRRLRAEKQTPVEKRQVRLVPEEVG